MCGIGGGGFRSCFCDMAARYKAKVEKGIVIMGIMGTMRSEEWYERNASEITDIVKGEIITRCCTHNGRLILLLSNGNELILQYNDFGGWQVALPMVSSISTCRIKEEKERFADAIKVLIDSFNRRVNADIEGIYVQCDPKPFKKADRYVVDVNVSL